MSVAARIDAYQKKYGGFYAWQSSSGPLATTATGLKVEIFVDESWVDISSDVRYTDKVKITGGRPSESSQLQAGTCRFTLNNTDRRYSPKNPTSPYYQKIGRNTPCRVSVEQVGTQRFRFYGEIAAWPQSQDKSGTNLSVSIEASGILRRLNQGVKPLRSSMYRAIMRETVDHIKVYWPCEDADEAVSIASAIPGIEPMDIDGTVNQATYSGFLASNSIPTFQVGRAKGVVPAYTVDPPNADGVGPYLRARFLLNVPSGGTTNGAVLFRMATAGTTGRWDVIYLTTSSGTLRLIAYDSNGIQQGASLDLTTAALNGKDVLVTLVVVDNTSVGGINVYYDDGTATTGTLAAFTGARVGQAKSITVTPNSDCSGVSIGQIWLLTDITPNLDVQTVLDGHKGETPFARISRLCNEEGVAFSGTDPGTDSASVMGTQTIDTLPALLQGCVDTDLGMLYEPRDQFGLEYRARLSLYNQDPHLTLDYAATDLFEPLNGVPDDFGVQNDVEVKRTSGSSARSVLESGALSIQPPPSGVGHYDTSITLNLEADNQLADQAGFRLFLYTVDESRYPGLQVHLNRANFVNSYDLTAAALTTKIADRILIQNPPDQETPDDVSVLVQGFEETIDQFEHVISFNGAPESPWHIAVVDGSGDFVSRVDTDGSVLTSAISDVATSISVTTTLGNIWTIDGADVPFDITVAGEVITVTAITGSSSPQTFTVTRSTNGVVKTQTAGTDVRLTHPGIISL